MIISTFTSMLLERREKSVVPSPEEESQKGNEEVAGETPQGRRRSGAPLARTAKQVIDQAIKDNRLSGGLLFGLLTIFAIVGVCAMGAGVLRGEGIVALAGGLSSVLLWPTIAHAREIRRENIALRMLEVPLSMASNAQEGSEALKEFFVNTFIKRHVQSTG